MSRRPVSAPRTKRPLGEIAAAFLGLGLTSFGGPVAHIGYFRNLFVDRRKWLTDKAFADLVALCQFLPGPASSQVAFGIGLVEAGLWGGIAAWTAFALPSALIMLLLALFSSHLGGATEGAILHGLKVVAVAVVAHAVWSMTRSLAPDFGRKLLAGGAAVFALLLPANLAQPLLIVLGALAGMALYRPCDLPRDDVLPPPRLSPRTAIIILALFAALFAASLPGVAVGPGSLFAMFAAFYRTGAMVFGGGHVVLPLLQQAVVAPGWISDHAFLAGYGAAQALPGPLFSIAAYLGALIGQPHGVADALVALVALSLPGLMLVAGLLPFWDRVRAHQKVLAAMQGVNACVIGILAAALYDPLWTSAMTTMADVVLAMAGFALLTRRQIPVLAVVALITAADAALALA